MIFSKETNYSIINSKSDFIRNIITKHILQINIEAGLYPNQSLFGKFIIVDSDANPIPNKKYIISYKERPDFKVINLDEDLLPSLFEILKTQDNKDYKAYIRNKIQKQHQSKPNILYYYMILLRECILPNNEFNFTKADIITTTYTFDNTSSALDKYKALNNYVTQPSETALFTLVKAFSEGQDPKKRLTSVAHCVKSIIDDSVPDYIKSRITFSQDTNTLLNYLTLTAELATFETFDEFINNMINRLP